MASNQNLKDRQSVLQEIESESNSLNLHSISFYLAQPTSGCYQETDKSIKISICEDEFSYFSQFVIALVTAENIRTGVKNLEFHNVEWEIQEVNSLGMLLDISSNVKQLVFKRNKFDAECLSKISDVIKRNKVIKEIMFSESGIRNLGAALLADALKVNDNLEKLQIWEDSIGSKGAEEPSKMIEANSTLKSLTIFDSNTLIATLLM